MSRGLWSVVNVLKTLNHPYNQQTARPRQVIIYSNAVHEQTRRTESLPPLQACCYSLENCHSAKLDYLGFIHSFTAKHSGKQAEHDKGTT